MIKINKQAKCVMDEFTQGLNCGLEPDRTGLD